MQYPPNKARLAKNLNSREKFIPKHDAAAGEPGQRNASSRLAKPCRRMQFPVNKTRKAKNLNSREKFIPKNDAASGGAG